MAPLDQEAQDSKSTSLLHQGTEMVSAGWPPAGQGPGGGLTTALRGSFVSVPSVAGKLPESSEEAGERRDPAALRDTGPLGPLPTSSPQSLGRATLAEAKFTFLCGAWGCVQSLGSAEPKIVVKCGPDQASPPLCSPEEHGPLPGARTPKGYNLFLRAPCWGLAAQTPLRVLSGPRPRPRGPLRLPGVTVKAGRLFSGPDHLPSGSLKTQERGLLPETRREPGPKGRVGAQMVPKP